MMGPVVWVWDQVFADGVVANVVPFFVVAVGSAKASVPFIFLPFPRWVRGIGGEAAFPVGDPAVEGNIGFVRRAEAMKVIGHQEIVAD